jgi:hypothetical protein
VIARKGRCYDQCSNALQSRSSFFFGFACLLAVTPLLTSTHLDPRPSLRPTMSMPRDFSAPTRWTSTYNNRCTQHKTRYTAPLSLLLSIYSPLCRLHSSQLSPASVLVHPGLSVCSSQLSCSYPLTCSETFLCSQSWFLHTYT